MSRTKNAIKIVISSGLNQFVLVVAGLILPPLIISTYGSEMNGLVNSVKQILGYFSVFSVGLGAAGQVALYEPLHKQEWNKINNIISEIAIFLNRVGVVFAIFISCYAFVLPVIRDDNCDYGTVMGIVLICGLGNLIEFVYLTRYKILLAADQKQFIVSSVYTQGTILNTILSVILIYYEAPILLVQFAATFAYLVRMLLLRTKVHRIYPLLNTNKDIVENNIPNTRQALLYKLSEIIINCIPVTVVTFICGYIDVSVYSVYNLVFSSIAMIVQIFATGLAATFGNQIAQKDYKTLKSSFKGYNFVFRTLSFFFYICSAILIVPFVSVYISNSDGVNYLLPTVGIMFAVHGICRMIRIPYITLVDAVGNYEENNKANYVEVVVNIIFSVVLTLRWGMIGVLVSGALTALYRSILFMIKINKNMLQFSNVKEVFVIIMNFLLGLFMCMIFKNISVNSYFDWFVLAIKIAGICGGSCLVLNIALDREGCKELLIRIIRKR